jgi:NAD(P)-dependent dehydrogenase (short-subunit alcohol dehydrogenase family)
VSRAPEIGDLLSLDGTVAMVTGASGGIGSAVARMLVAAGARVVGVDLPGETGPDEVQTIACDVSNAAGVSELFREFGRRFDRLDVMVHCAGIRRDAVVWKMDDAAWSEVLRVNLDSAFHLVKQAVPIMRARGSGSIVLVSSINAERGKFGQSNYSASKAGLIGLGRTVALETGKFGVRANVVAPGMIETAMTSSLPEEFIRQAREEAALGRMGQPEDVARVVLFLASPMSGHVTGQVLRVDGGQLMA